MPLVVLSMSYVCVVGATISFVLYVIYNIQCNIHIQYIPYNIIYKQYLQHKKHPTTLYTIHYTIQYIAAYHVMFSFYCQLHAYMGDPVLALPSTSSTALPLATLVGPPYSAALTVQWQLVEGDYCTTDCRLHWPTSSRSTSQWLFHGVLVVSTYSSVCVIV